MSRAKWILRTPDRVDPTTGRKNEGVAVYSRADLRRRKKAAKSAGVKVTTRRLRRGR